MNLVKNIIENNIIEAKKSIIDRLNEIAFNRLKEAKIYIAADRFEPVNESKNSNLIKMGRVTRIRRRIRRNARGQIYVQKNSSRSNIRGYRVSGNTIRRIPATELMKRRRLLKRSWQTSRRAKLRRSLMKRKISMRRRTSLGLR